MSGLVESSADARSKTIGQNYRVRAWVNFNGTGTVAIRSSANVSSITDMSTGGGNYRVNFTSAMPNANYVGVMYNSAFTGTSEVSFSNHFHGGMGGKTTTYIGVCSHDTSGFADSEMFDVVIIG